MTKPFSVFLSRVSGEFKDVCVELASRNSVDGRAPFVKIIEQSQDQQDSATEYILTRSTVAKLILWLEKCSHFFHLAGLQHGSEAKLPLGEKFTREGLETALIESCGRGLAAAEIQKVGLLADSIQAFRQSVGHAPTYTQLEFLIGQVYVGQTNVCVLFIGADGDCTDRQRAYRIWLNGKCTGMDRVSIPGPGTDKEITGRLVRLEIENRLLDFNRAKLAGMITKARGENLWEQLGTLLPALEHQALAEEAAASFRQAVMEALEDDVPWVENTGSTLAGDLHGCWEMFSGKGDTVWLVHAGTKVTVISIPAGGKPREVSRDLGSNARVYSICRQANTYDILFGREGACFVAEIGGDYREWQIADLSLPSFAPVTMARVPDNGTSPVWVVGQIANEWRLTCETNRLIRAVARVSKQEISPSFHQLLTEQIVEIHGRRRGFIGRRPLAIAGDPTKPWVLLGGPKVSLVKLRKPSPLHEAFKMFDHWFSSPVTLFPETRGGDIWLKVLELNKGTLFGTAALCKAQRDEEALLVQYPQAGLASELLKLLENSTARAVQSESPPGIQMNFISAHHAESCVSLWKEGAGQRVMAWTFPHRFSHSFMLALHRKGAGAEAIEYCPTGRGPTVAWTKPHPETLPGLLLACEA